MLTRRDFLSGQIKRQKNPECKDREKVEDDNRDKIQAIEADFSDDMLYREMMKLGKDPSNMDREQMLQTVLGEMKIK